MPQRWRQSSSSRSTEVRDEALTQHRPPGQLLDRPAGEEHHAVHRAIAGDGEVGKQVVARRVPGVLDRGDHAHLSAPAAMQVVQLGGGAGDELGRHLDQAAVDARRTPDNS